MPSTCEFELNHPNGVYYSGDTVSGRIILKTTNPKDIRDVSIIFKGKGKVRWSETERRRKSDGSPTSHTIYFEAQELYISNTTVVCRANTLPAGTHVYTFLIPLPIQCPSTCDWTYGSINYKLKLKIDRPFRIDNEFNKCLTVIKTVDLNLNPSFKFPVESEDIFSSCFFSCSGGKIYTTLKIPVGAFAIGQSLNYSLYIQNQTMSDIDGYSLEFSEKIIYTAHTPRHKTREEKSNKFTRSYDNTCLRLTTRIFEGHFVIPSTSTSTEGQNIITVHHKLKFIIHLAGCNTDNDIYLPIFIGNIPIRESLVPPAPTEVMTPASLMPLNPTAPELPQDQTYDDLPPSYQELSPPSFEEVSRRSSALTDTDKNKSHIGHIGFIPPVDTP